MYIRNIALCAGIISLVSCAAFKPTPRVLNPARAPQVAELNTVAISQFKGKDGELFRSELQARLLSENGKQGIFTVLTSTKKAEGIFSGQVLESSVTYRTYQKEVEECADKDCKTKRKVNVECIDRKANFKVAIEVNKQKKNEIIYSSTFSGDDTDTYCKNSSSTPITNEAMLQKARTKVIEEIRKDVAPYYTGGELLLFRPDKWME